MKIRAKRHIIWVLFLLLAAGLSVGTFHTHKVLEWNHAETHHNLDHSLTDYTADCPICGYLVKFDFTAVSGAGIYLMPLEILPPETPPITSFSYLTERRGRSPPFPEV
ncbi:MAG: hypothetical protein R3211_11860 [Balneolaceae bacterium]|nr:hypothetical protein [Balneolaceae bacterium]